MPKVNDINNITLPVYKRLKKEIPDMVVPALVGKEINVEGITSKGIANTGNIANIGDIGTTGKITGGEIVENMSGYSFTKPIVREDVEIEYVYAGVVKNGNKITFVTAFNITRLNTIGSNVLIGTFNIPESVAAKLFLTQVGQYNFLDNKVLPAFLSHSSKIDLCFFMGKTSNSVSMNIDTAGINNLVANTKYYIRYEATFLLSENLAEE